VTGVLPDLSVVSVVRGETEPIDGWRVWRVTWGLCGLVSGPTVVTRWPDGVTGNGPELRSLASDSDWVPRKENRARCDAGARLHTAPAVNCFCGFWAYRDREAAEKILLFSGQPYLVLGRVKLWGDIVEHEHGYRAEYAYPYEIHVPYLDGARGDLEAATSLARALAARYAVDAHPAAITVSGVAALLGVDAPKLPESRSPRRRMLRLAFYLAAVAQLLLAASARHFYSSLILTVFAVILLFLPSLFVRAEQRAFSWATRRVDLPWARGFWRAGF
jgi:hypothetical protein